MNILIGILIWWLIGFISCCILDLYMEKQITVKDLLDSLMMGFGGFIMIIVLVVILYTDFSNKFGDKVIYKKKEK